MDTIITYRSGFCLEGSPQNLYQILSFWIQCDESTAASFLPPSLPRKLVVPNSPKNSQIDVPSDIW